MQSQTVKDLMVPQDAYATIEADATLGQAALRLQEVQQREQVWNPERHRDRALLVIDEEGEVVGKLSMLDVLSGLVPRYDLGHGASASSKAASRVGSARLWIDSVGRDAGLWKKPLANLIEKAANVSVRRLIRPLREGESIDESESIDLALHQLIKGSFQSLLVTRQGKIIGILRLTDVYEKISEMLQAAARVGDARVEGD